MERDAAAAVAPPPPRRTPRLRGPALGASVTALVLARCLVFKRLSARGQARVEAERAWLALAPRVPAHVFRLAGIYGPFRSALDSARRAPPRPADAEGRGRGGAPAKFVSRVHVDDICAALLASARRPLPGEVPPTGACKVTRKAL